MITALAANEWALNISQKTIDFMLIKPTTHRTEVVSDGRRCINWLGMRGSALKI